MSLSFLEKLAKYEIGKSIGRGICGDIYRCRLKNHPDEIFALKTLDKNTKREIYREIEILKVVNHPNIIFLVDYFEDDERIYLINKYYPGGDLYKKLKATGKFPEALTKKYTRQIVMGMIYLHSKNIIHRDLKSDNIFLDEDDNAVIGDFSWAVMTNTLRKTCCGTLDYLSPEIVNGEEYGSETDIWSLGVLVYELLTDKMPFYASTYKQTYQLISKGQPDFPEILSEQAIDFIKTLLTKDREKRIKDENILEHMWLASCEQMQN